MDSLLSIKLAKKENEIVCGINELVYNRIPWKIDGTF